MTADKENSISTLLSLEAEKNAAGALVADLYRLLKVSAIKEFQKWRIKGGVQVLHRQLKRYRMVKTILDRERPVDLATFYYPTSIVRRGSLDGNWNTVVHDIDQLPENVSVLVQGYVGQGKSIFLRYLALKELVRGRGSIPLLVEMRDIRGRSLVDFLRDELGALGLQMSPTLFDFFAKEGRFVFFLDGFDEIDESEQGRVVGQIGHLARRFEKSRIIASSRPGSAIVSSRWFESVHLAEFEPSDRDGLIARLTDPATAQKISRLLRDDSPAEHRPRSIGTVITTPLMAALLVVRFRIEQTIPENDYAFYDDLFDLLIRRHDQGKGGYRRNRRSGVGDHDLRRIFNGVCFLSRRRGTKKEFTLNTLHEDIAGVCGRLSIAGAADAIAADIIMITNLILEEGGYCNFVHKSVQEFHAACFVAMIGGEFARDFYATAFRRGGWEEEIRFLKQMDRHNFERHLLYPVLHLWLKTTSYGDRWFEAVTGLCDESRAYDWVDTPRYVRVKSLLAGYLDISDVREKPPRFLADKLKEIRDQVAKSIENYNSVKTDFGLRP